MGEGKRNDTGRNPLHQGECDNSVRHGGSHTLPAQSTTDNGHLSSAKPPSPHSVALRREEGGRKSTSRSESDYSQAFSQPCLALPPPHTESHAAIRFGHSRARAHLSLVSPSGGREATNARARAMSPLFIEEIRSTHV